MNSFLFLKAKAEIRGGEGYENLTGKVLFYQKPEGVIVLAVVKGLPEDSPSGFFALHIHEGANCTGEGFSDTGNHYNPEGNPHPIHRGDLPPLLSNDGMAYMQVLTDRFRVKDIIGKTVVIHSEPDDFTTQPSGNAGTKIACGKIIRL